VTASTPPVAAPARGHAKDASPRPRRSCNHKDFSDFRNGVGNILKGHAALIQNALLAVRERDNHVVTAHFGLCAWEVKFDDLGAALRIRLRDEGSPHLHVPDIGFAGDSLGA